MEDGLPERVQHGLVRAVRSVPSLASLEADELLALAGDSANLFWPAGSVVFERGSAADGLYVVLTGSVRVLDAAGEEVGVLGPGEVFGEFSLLLRTPHQHDVVAAEDSELMAVPKERIEVLLESRPVFARAVRARLEARQAANAPAPGAAAP